MKKIITGITVKEQMEKAIKILNDIVIPREKEFQKRKKNGSFEIKNASMT